MKSVTTRIIIGIFCIGVILGGREFLRKADGKTHVAFFDVGQGDSALLTFPDGSRMLIDGGPDWSTLEHLGRSLPFMDRSIDVIVLSHPNADHMMSLPEVLRRYHVRTLLTAGTVFSSGRYAATLSGASMARINILSVQAGDSINIGNAVIHVVWPPQERPPAMSKSENNDSLTLLIETPEKRILFTGDMESIVERTLVQAGVNLRADILKVAHHGSKSSSSTGFLLAVQPTIAVISVGSHNPYGHPSEEVLQRLQAIGADVRRTDQGGTVELVW